jgi:hypothetical protein
MLEKTWWYKCSNMESWNRTICCPMNYSNGRKHAQAKGNRRSHATMKCCGKRKVLLLTHVKVLKRKRRWSTINLTSMIETTRAQFLK